MARPVGVLINDIHYSLPTLTLADKALRMAIDTANNEQVPLYIVGDLHDTKANLRGECTNAMIQTLKTARTQVYLIIGNHDRINEKGLAHSLEFLEPYARIINSPCLVNGLYCIPYNPDREDLRDYLKTIPKGSTLLIHQGVIGTDAGEYIQDKSALDMADIKGFRVLAAHYHPRQTIDSLDFLGNPYTVTFGEAKDKPKGFNLLHKDGSLDHIETKFRKHVIVDVQADRLKPVICAPNDLVWVKLRGPKEQLDALTRPALQKALGIESFKLDRFPESVETTIEKSAPTQQEWLDDSIDKANISKEQAARLKSAWRGLCDPS